MSGLVELGVIVAMSASERIGEIALPSPLICGPTSGHDHGVGDELPELVAAWAGSY